MGARSVMVMMRRPVHFSRRMVMMGAQECGRNSPHRLQIRRGTGVTGSLLGEFAVAFAADDGCLGESGGSGADFPATWAGRGDQVGVAPGCGGGQGLIEAP